MELKQFVSETLNQIVLGVKEAQNNLSKEGCEINPVAVGGYDILKHEGFMETKSGNYVQMVEFDVVLGAAEGMGTRGGVGLIIGPIALGSKGESRSENTYQNHVRFKVPLSLPRAKLER